MRKILICILGIMALFMLGCGTGTTTDNEVDYVVEVSDLNGTLVEGATVELVNLDTGDTYTKISDQNGRALFEGIDSESSYSLTIVMADYPTFNATVSPDSTGVEVILQGTGAPETGSSLTIVNKSENTVLYPDWYIDYPSDDSIYDFAPDAVGDDWGLLSGNYSQNQVVPESTYYVYFIYDGINEIFRSTEPVVVEEGEHIVYVIDEEADVVTTVESNNSNDKRANILETKDQLREIFKAKKQK